MGHAVHIQDSLLGFCGMTGGHKGADCSERDVGVFICAKKRQWPDVGIARVTQGGLVKYAHCHIGDYLFSIFMQINRF